MKQSCWFIISLIFPLQCMAGTVAIGGGYNVSVSSIVEQRFKTIYRQRYDFSCGSATLASLLSFHYDDKVSEWDVFKDMFNYGDKALIQQRGFSLLDMKRYLERRGYRANGFNLNLEQLNAAQVPAITIINTNGYLHFVIIKGQAFGDVLIGDPAAGLKAIPRASFESMWDNRIVFLIQGHQELAQKHYNDDVKRRFKTRANLGLAISYESLSAFNVLRPTSNDF